MHPLASSSPPSLIWYAKAGDVLAAYMPSKHAVRGIYAATRGSKHAVRGISAVPRGSKHAVRGISAATRNSKHAAAAVPPAAAAAAAGDCRTNYIILHPLLTIIQYRSKIGPWRLIAPGWRHIIVVDTLGRVEAPPGEVLPSFRVQNDPTEEERGLRLRSADTA